MAKEIERKFLVKKDKFDPDKYVGAEIVQAYLSSKPDATVRVRISGCKAYLTIKNRNQGIEREEWEYHIPVRDAYDILSNCGCTSKIEKTRYRIGRWEVDLFHGDLTGLIMAEIELDSDDEEFVTPDFIGREVTYDPRYYNSALISAEVLPPFD